MARRKVPEDLSVEELRRLLIEKRGSARRERLEHFRRTGRMVAVAPEAPNDRRSAAVVDTPEEGQEVAEPVRSKRRRTMDRILLGVEILAVLSLVGVLLSGLGMLSD